MIIRESHLDTNATSTNIRTNLTKLDKYLPTIGHDITKFNTYVKILVEGLKSRGETTQDLLVNLFKGYLACSDKEFVRYITTKKDAHEEGVSINLDKLMTFADNKYKTLVQNETWNAPDANEEKILALQVELKKLKAQKGKSNKTNKQAPKKREKNPKVKVKNNRLPDFFGKKPKKGDEMKPKTWKGKLWYFCGEETGGKCAGLWRRHKPSKCEGKAAKKAEGESDKRKLKLNPALQAAVAHSEGNDMETDSE